MSDIVSRKAFLSEELAELAEIATKLKDSDIEDSSRSTYDRLNVAFDAFCEEHHLRWSEPATVALYIGACVKAEDSKSTLRTRLAAIARRAADEGIENPCAHPAVRDISRGGQKKLAGKQRRATPATYDILPRLVACAKGSTRLRDIALILLGFALGRRGSELAGVDVEHIERVENGIIVEIPYSKTNKSGEPEYIGVPRFEGDPFCPVTALDAWLEHAGITTGPVFLTLSPVKGRGGNRMRREDVSRRLDAIATAANLDGFWASHSLRRGVVTSAEQKGVARSRTRMLTGWKTDAMFAVYADHRELIRHSPLHEIYGRRKQRQAPLFHDE